MGVGKGLVCRYQDADNQESRHWVGGGLGEGWWAVIIENSDLQAGIWFDNVAPSPIITIPHSLMVKFSGNVFDFVFIFKVVVIF